MQTFMKSDPPSALEISNALIDFGFYHEFSEVARMYAELQNNKLLGYSGGVNEQPSEYWQDISTMRWLALWVEHVAPLPRMKQESWIDKIKQGVFNGEWLNNGDN